MKFFLLLRLFDCKMYAHDLSLSQLKEVVHLHM